MLNLNIVYVNYAQYDANSTSDYWCIKKRIWFFYVNPTRQKKLSTEFKRLKG